MPGFRSMTTLQCKSFFNAYNQSFVKETSRHTDEERAIFRTIMGLQRGFEDIVYICVTDPDVFFTLIKLVSHYMRSV